MKSYQSFVEQKRKEYKSYVPVFSPALREWVTFNAEGFGHLRFTPDGKAREQNEQIYKLNLLPLVIRVIESTRSINACRRIFKNNLVKVTYWSLVARVGNPRIKVKVIIRKVGNKGKVHFWSVMRLKK